MYTVHLKTKRITVLWPIWRQVMLNLSKQHKSDNLRVHCMRGWFDLRISGPVSMRYLHNMHNGTVSTKWERVHGLKQRHLLELCGQQDVHDNEQPHMQHVCKWVLPKRDDRDVCGLRHTQLSYQHLHPVRQWHQDVRRVRR